MLFISEMQKYSRLRKLVKSQDERDLTLLARMCPKVNPMHTFSALSSSTQHPPEAKGSGRERSWHVLGRWRAQVLQTCMPSLLTLTFLPLPTTLPLLALSIQPQVTGQIFWEAFLQGQLGLKAVPQLPETIRVLILLFHSSKPSLFSALHYRLLGHRQCSTSLLIK